VTLAGVEATVTSFTDAKLVVVAQALPEDYSGSDTSVVIISDTGALVEVAAAFEYYELGAVATVEPAAGQLNTQVTIAGTNLRGHGEAVISVTLAGEEV
jgi:hypothetical protein